MNQARVKKLIHEGEGISIEFKECRNNSRVFSQRIDGGFNRPYLIMKRKGWIVGHRVVQPEASRLSRLSKGRCEALRSAVVFGRRQKV